MKNDFAVDPVERREAKQQSNSIPPSLQRCRWSDSISQDIWGIYTTDFEDDIHHFMTAQYLECNAISEKINEGIEVKQAFVFNQPIHKVFVFICLMDQLLAHTIDQVIVTEVLVSCSPISTWVC